MKSITGNLIKSLNESEEVPSIEGTMADYARTIGGVLDADTFDTEIDTCIYIYYDVNEDVSDNYGRFIKDLCEITNVVKANNSGIVCDYSNALKPFNEQWKEIFNMDNSEFDEDEAYYEAVDNLDRLVAGYGGEKLYGEIADILESKTSEPITEAEEVDDGTWTEEKLLNADIEVYDIKDMVEKEHPQYTMYAYGEAAILVANDGKYILAEEEAIHRVLNDANEMTKLPVYGAPEEKVNKDGSVTRTFGVYPSADMSINIATIKEKCSSKTMKGSDFFTKYNYNSRCEYNFNLLLKSLNGDKTIKEDSYEDVVGFDKERELNKLHGNNDTVEKNLDYLEQNLPGNVYNDNEDFIRKQIEFIVDEGSDLNKDGYIMDLELLCDDINEFFDAYDKGELASLKLNVNLFGELEEILYGILKDNGYTYAANPRNAADKEAMKIVPIGLNEDGYSQLQEKKVPTGLTDDKAKEIIDSVIGQLSDGIWENSPGMDKYWAFTDGLDNDGNLVVQTGFTVYDYGKNPLISGFNKKTDDEIKKYFATKIKQIVKDEGLNWDRNNTEICEYLDRGSGVTVQDAYRVYDKLLNRVDRITESDDINGAPKDIIKFIDIAENLGWNADYREQSYISGDEDKHQVDLEIWDSSGGDFCVEISGNTFEELCDSLNEYYEAYDPDEEFDVYYEAGKNGLQGVPSPSELMRAMEEREQMLKDLYDAETKSSSDLNESAEETNSSEGQSLFDKFIVQYLKDFADIGVIDELSDEDIKNIALSMQDDDTFWGDLDALIIDKVKEYINNK